MVNRLLTALVACALVVASAPLSERRGAAAGSSVASAGVPVFLPRPLDFAPFVPALEALPAARLAELDALVSTADIPTLRARLAGGEVETRELVLAYLSRIRRFDGALAAVIELNPDALREAVRLDAQRAAGSGTGPLHGIPILLKDNIATGDRQRTTVGALALADHRAPRDAEVVARLREAGALILGKTNLSEWAYFMSSAAPSGFSALGGQTSNPHGADLAVLGSSTGSAVAAAARFAAATLGTETTGSIVAPAAANGVAGMRPTLGLVSGDLIAPITTALDSAGPIAPSVRDLAELLDVLTGGDFTSALGAGSLDGLRVGVPDIASRVDGAAGAVLERVVRVLERAGASVVPVALPPDSVVTLVRGQVTLLAGGMRGDVDAWLADTAAPLASLADVVAFNALVPATRAPYGQDLLVRARDGGLEPSTHAALASRLRATSLAAMRAGADAAGADVLLSLDNTFSLFYALGGTPAVTVPAGLDANGQPHGATFVGIRPDTDAALLAVAHAFERAARARIEPTLRR